MSNPNNIPRAKFVASYGNIYYQPIPNGVLFDYPKNPLIGQDDFAASHTEDDNPYSESDRPELAHSVGQIASTDAPSLLMPTAGAHQNDVISQTIHFQEFVRVQIGQNWYVISDPLSWKIHEGITFLDGEWLDDDSYLGADQ